MIVLEQLCKTYAVPVKKPGLLGSLRSLVDREVKTVRAVDDVSFTIAQGERVGFLGPNGAGKTTTLKVLCGLLHPTSGRVEVLGHEPRRRDPAYLRQITLVMGQKQQLLWDLPAHETFELNRALYDIDRAEFVRTKAQLIEMLSLGPILDQPVRQLSLGQRMRCELAAALLHRPKVLFLDEPTIGLDVAVQKEVRDFIAATNKEMGATVMLTSHDMKDVAALCKRIILIDHGKVRFDGTLEALQRSFGAGRRLLVRDAPDLQALGFQPDGEGGQAHTVDAREVNALLAAVLERAPEALVTVADPPLEEVLAQAFGARDRAEAS